MQRRRLMAGGGTQKNELLFADLRPRAAAREAVSSGLRPFLDAKAPAARLYPRLSWLFPFHIRQDAGMIPSALLPMSPCPTAFWTASSLRWMCGCTLLQFAKSRRARG